MSALRRVCGLAATFNNVLSRGISGKLQNGEMNTVTAAVVFLCGAACAGVGGLLWVWWVERAGPGGASLGSLGVLPAGVDLNLMDDGYVAMALLGDHGDHQALSKKQTTELEDQHTQVEALNTIKAAKQLAYSGKRSRAGRLMEHALSLAPRHPEVLIHYGEFLEEHRNDVVEADKLYLRALAVSPANSRALRNRRRTQPLAEEMDSATLDRIDSKRHDLAQIPRSSAALRRIKKEAYFQYIYHTAGIEGNTLTLAQTRMILETRLSVGGKSVMEHNEILGLDLALKFINTTLVHRVGRITLYDILEIHRRVLGHVDPLEAGQLRTTQVYVSDHVPPPPTHLQVLMQDFVTWLNSPEAQALHPIKYAALAHYKLVFIHPFSDGNGRTARLIMNFLLMQAGYPPVIIRKQDRLTYYDCLQTANEGDTRPFVRFIAYCTEKTLDVYLWATKEVLPKIGQQDHTASSQDDSGREFREEATTFKHSEDDILGENNDRSEGKFIFTSIEDLPPWEEASGHTEPERKTPTPSGLEDDILEDEEEEKDERDHLWFVNEEERVRVRGTGRVTRTGGRYDQISEGRFQGDSDDSRGLPRGI